MVVWFYPVSIACLAYLAGRLNRDAVGDGSSGFLSLLALTDTSALEWTITRVIQNVIGFLSVWLVRLPFLCLFYTLGGLRLFDLVIYECLLLGLFMALMARAMSISHKTDSRQSTDISGISTLFFLEFCLSAPKIVVGLMAFLGLTFPLKQQANANAMADSLWQLTLQRWFMGINVGGLLLEDLWQYLLLYLIIALFYLRSYSRHLYDQIGNTPEPVLKSSKEKRKVPVKRSSLPRCWEDALAWQSYVYYAGGSENVTGRVILYGVAFAVYLFTIVTGMYQPLMVIILLGSGVTFLNLMNTPAHCLDKEFKAKTFSSLLLTPHEGLDFYYGWRRGMLNLSLTDHLFILAMLLLLMLKLPMVALAAMSVVVAIHLMGPFLMLSFLVSFSWKSVGVCIFIFIGLIATVGIGIAVSLTTVAMAFPLGFLPSFWLYNYIIRQKFLEHWFSVRIEQEI